MADGVVTGCQSACGLLRVSLAGILDRTWLRPFKGTGGPVGAGGAGTGAVVNWSWSHFMCLCL